MATAAGLTRAGLPRQAGYAHGLPVALQLFDDCQERGVEELTFYGFTQDNTKRAAEQRHAFQAACVEAVELLADRDAAVLVVGNTHSPMFPSPLLPYTRRTRFGRGTTKVNLLVNYSWQWDIDQALQTGYLKRLSVNDRELPGMGSAEVSRIDLVVRWGQHCRLSGFLPIQTVYADIYVVDALWPDYSTDNLENALAWYQMQDVTLGG